jgi:hypothetical protein
MKTIWKYQLNPGKGSQEIPVPKGSKFKLPFKVLFVHLQNKIPYIWIFFDMNETNNPIQTSGGSIKIRTFSTGETIPENFKESDWIGTYFVEEYDEVYHIFLDSVQVG